MLRRDRLAALVRFALGGALSASVVLGMSALLREGGFVGERAAAAIGLASALAVNFATMRLFVFRGTRRPIAGQALGYLASSAVFRGLEYAGFLALHSLLALHYLVALLLSLAASFLLKFLFYDGWLFRREQGDGDRS